MKILENFQSNQSLSINFSSLHDDFNAWSKQWKDDEGYQLLINYINLYLKETCFFPYASSWHGPVITNKPNLPADWSIHQIVCSGPNLEYWRHGLILTKKDTFYKKRAFRILSTPIQTLLFMILQKNKYTCSGPPVFKNGSCRVRFFKLILCHK